MGKTNQLGSGGIIVAGFHRSGTSALTQMLDAAGVRAGDDLMVANEFNKSGYFESWEVVRLHDRIMSASEADWASPLSVDVEVSEAHLAEMKNVIIGRADTRKQWCLKDPRQTRFLNEWKSVGPGLKFVLIYRDPAESVFSLQRRQMQLLARSGGMDELAARFLENSDLGATLWRDHNRKLLDFAMQFPDDCLIVSHSAIVQGFDVLSLLSKKFGLPAPSAKIVRSTINKNLVTRDAPVLNIKCRALLEEIGQVWNGLTKLDASCPEPNEITRLSRSLNLDPTGVAAENIMLHVQALEANRVAKSNWVDRQTLLDSGTKLVHAVSKPLFAWYFLRRKK